MCAVLDEGNVFTIFTTDIAILVRGLYDPAERNIQDVLCVEDSEKLQYLSSICLAWLCVAGWDRERERLGVDCSFYCNKTKCWQPGPSSVISLSRGCGQAGWAGYWR